MLVNLGEQPIPYVDCLSLQNQAVEARKLAKIDDRVYLLEHTPVITIGRSSQGDKYMVSSRELLNKKGIEVFDTERGGDITYHAPGQLVCYPIIDLNLHGRDLHRYIRGLETCIIEILGELGVEARAINGLTGVWVGESKIAAIGIKVSRWVTSHGLSINNTLDLRPMRDDIVACGLVGKSVTSLQELGINVTMDKLKALFARSLCGFFGIAGEIVNASVEKELKLMQDLISQGTISNSTEKMLS